MYWARGVVWKRAGLIVWLADEGGKPVVRGSNPLGPV